MWRSPAFAVVLAALVLLAGCSGPTVDVGGSTTHTPETAPAEMRTTAADPTAVATTDREFADPASDVKGWENGYWYDENLSVTTADGLDEDELDAVVARAMARVERLRDVEFERDVSVEVITRDELASGESGDGGGGDGRSDARTVQAAKYRALFLVGDGESAASESASNRKAAVQGYYSIREDRIVLVSDSETPLPNEVTLSQELVHAYQFRHLSLSLPASPTEDEVAALVAVVEGDANYVDRLYERRCDGAWECVGTPTTDGSGGSDGTTDRPDIHWGLYLLQYFPYSDGEALVRDVYRRDGWDGVHGLYEDPPRSTEQVIHPERMDDAPERVAVPDLSTAEWTRVPAGESDPYVTVGEAGLATMFMYTDYDERRGNVVARESFLNLDDDGQVNATDPLDYALNYSDGWAGDSLAVYRDGDATGYVWRLRWDDEAEAREFAAGYRALLRYRGGTKVDGHWRLDGEFAGAYAVAVRGRTVTVVHAPTHEGLTELWPVEE